MRNASGQPNERAGSSDWFTIEVPSVALEVCEASWSLDNAKTGAYELREASGLAAFVNVGSPEPLQTAVFHCNTFLIREFDFKRQYDWMDDDPNHIAYLWGEPVAARDANAVAVFGACCFRQRGLTHAMQWIWLHPYARRRGHLTAAWNYFRTRFGPFLVEPPYSTAMEHFSRNRKGNDAADKS